MLKKEWKRPELEVLDVSMTMSNGKGHNNGNNNGNNNNGNAPGHGYDAGPGRVLAKVMVLCHVLAVDRGEGPLYEKDS